MKKFVFATLALCCLSLSLSRSAVAQTETQLLGNTIPSISVNGTCVMKLVPDVIHISIILNEADTKGKVSLAEQQKRMKAALKKCDVNIEEQLSVLDMDNVFNRRKRALSSSKYELRVSTAAQARKVFDELENVGISNVSVTHTSVSDMASKCSEARRLAILNAKHKAEELADALGQSVGDCYEINDYNNDYQEGSPVLMKTVRAFGTRNGDVAEDAIEEDIEFQEHTLRYSVSAKFILKFSEKGEK